MKLAVLAGGVGAARFLRGLSGVADPQSLTAIVNTADDFLHLGLHISPDIDTVCYTLAGIVDEARGWGVGGDGTACLEMLGRLGEETWFQLGDRDLGLHLTRSRRLREGARLSAVTEEIRTALEVPVAILPATDDPVATEIETPEGTLPFQEYFVRRACRDKVLGVGFRGAEQSHPAPGVREALASAAGIIISPSNPVVSIAPILAVPGLRDAIAESGAPVVAISPIIGGRTVKGPAASMLRDLGHEASALGVARIYEKLATTFVLDTVDAPLASAIEALGMRVLVCDTLMADAERARRLATAVIGLIRP